MSWGKIIPWVLVGALLVLFIMDLQGCFKPRPGIVEKPMQDSIIFWKTKLGDSIKSLRAKEADFADIHQKDLDSIARLLDTKSDLVQEIISLKSHGQVTLPAAPEKPPVIVYVDSGKGEKIESITQVFSNPYYQVVAQIHPDNYNLSTAQVQTFDSLLLTWKYVKTGGLFNRKTYLQLDVKNANPYNEIYQAEAFRRAPVDPPKWGIGIFAGWGYGFNVVGGNYGYPIIGVGITRTFIRF